MRLGAADYLSISVYKKHYLQCLSGKIVVDAEVQIRGYIKITTDQLSRKHVCSVSVTTAA